VVECPGASREAIHFRKWPRSPRNLLVNEQGANAASDATGGNRIRERRPQSTLVVHGWFIYTESLEFIERYRWFAINPTMGYLTENPLSAFSAFQLLSYIVEAEVRVARARTRRHLGVVVPRPPRREER